LPDGNSRTGSFPLPDPWPISHYHLAGAAAEGEILDQSLRIGRCHQALCSSCRPVVSVQRDCGSCRFGPDGTGTLHGATKYLRSTPP